MGFKFFPLEPEVSCKFQSGDFPVFLINSNQNLIFTDLWRPHVLELLTKRIKTIYFQEGDWEIDSEIEAEIYEIDSFFARILRNIYYNIFPK